MKKTYEVWHSEPPDFWSERDVKAFPDGWVKVADVTADCPEGVFTTMQHYDKVRSTSVGDVVVEGSTAYRCEPRGWTSHTINSKKED